MTPDRSAKQSLIISGIAAISDSYDGFFIDQWGVIHNGAAALAGAPEALRHLKRLGKAVVLISNSSRLCAESRAMLARLGFSDAHYDALITSGELTREYLAHNKERLGRRVKSYYRGRGSMPMLAALGFDEVEAADAADFLLITGFCDAPPQHYRSDLQCARRRGLTMVCGNPDMLTVAPDGALKTGPGAIAAIYRDMGGHVIALGKPHKTIYENALGQLRDIKGQEISPARVLAIGDSLAHDIAGGNNAGCDTLLIAAGIHKHEICPPDAAKIKALSDKTSIRADYVCETFRL